MRLSQKQVVRAVRTVQTNLEGSLVPLQLTQGLCLGQIGWFKLRVLLNALRKVLQLCRLV